jgi:UDP-hydrolysing UDP-N-acetyl-D-glucosamine 2-epimerase
MRTIGVVTCGRSDYGIYLPVLHAIRSDPELRLSLIVTGMHLSREFGLTVETIEGDGFKVDARVEMLLSSDTPEGIAKSIGIGSIGFAQLYAQRKPDILLVLGDRFEMLAAVAASLPFNIPLAHIHGGESTEGLIDEAIRHAITKMSHLHFVSTPFYARRVIQMGEEPWRVVVSGAPSLDNIRTTSLLNRQEIENRYGFSLEGPVLLVTYHPVTLEYRDAPDHLRLLLAALEKSGAGLVFTCPNADTYGRRLLETIQEFCQRVKRASLIMNLGTRDYFSLMSHASAMVGNSSSGIIEAASFQLPVVNIGNRQRGRVHGENVIDVGNDAEEILGAIHLALSSSFRTRIAKRENPYGDGRAADRILARLKTVPLDETLLLKQFHTIEEPPPCG